MERNLVVCCDGTSNEYKENNTNVVKLYGLLTHDSECQIAYYHPGVGTMEAVGALTRVGRKVTKLLGLAIGYGLEAEIVRAYTFLMTTYRPGDRIYLFGFSRGAYTVRAVASLLHMYGLIRLGNEDLVRYAIRMQAALSSGSPEEGEAQQTFGLAKGFRQTFSEGPCPVHFVGVWDTVSSVGWFTDPVRMPYTANNPSVAIGRHAVSIDERRAFFRPNLWRPGKDGGPRDLRQVWFPGSHCDVGGGYPPDGFLLSDIALGWMAREAVNAGLLVQSQELEKLPVAPPGAGVKFVHESLRGWWRLAEFVPKHSFSWETRKRLWRMNRFRRRALPSDAEVHLSAQALGEAYCSRLPAGVSFVA